MNLNYGLNIADRQTGKTTALIKFLEENTDYCMIVPTYDQVTMARSHLTASTVNASRVVTIQNTRRNHYRKFLYDNYFDYSEKIHLGPEDIAVGTPHFPVSIIGK